MKNSLQGAPSPRRTWRAFSARDGRRIESFIHAGEPARCPCCAGTLEAHRQSRSRRKLPLDAMAVDLECRACRRFWSVIQHTERSLMLMRMRRFVAALRAVEPKPVADVAATA